MKRFIYLLISVALSVLLVHCEDDTGEKNKGPRYEVTLASADSPLQVEAGQSVPIVFHVRNTDGIDIAKTLSYTSDLAGSISYGGDIYGPDTDMPIEGKGDVSLVFRPTRVGNGELKFTFVGDNEQTETVPISIEVQKAYFTWNLKGEPLLSVYPNEPAEISIDFKPNPNMTGYTWRYTSTSGTLMLGEAEKNPNRDYDLTGVQTLALRYSDSQSGVRELTFTASDGSGHRETVTVEITVEKPRYEATLASESSPLQVEAGQSVPIVFHVRNTDGVNIAKTLSYTSDLAGSISYGDKTYSPGADIPIEGEGDVSLVFRPTRVGRGELKFTFADENEQTETVAVSVEVQKAYFTWNLKGEALLSVYPNESAEIDIDFAPNSNLTGYTWRYTSTGGTLMLGEAEKNPDQDYDLTGAQTLALRYSDSQSGLQELTFTADDGSGHGETISVAVTVEKPRYEVSLASASSVKVKAGQSIPIAFQVRNTDGVSIAKTLSYTGDLAGSISYGDKTYSPGADIPIEGEGDISLVFRPTRVGRGELKFTFAGDNEQTETVAVSIEVQSLEFTWRLTSEPSLSVYPNESADIDIDFAPNSNLTGYTWRYTSTGGTLMLDEAEKNPDQDYGLTGAQTLALRYSDSQSGVRELTFTAVDKFGHSETVSVAVTVEKPRYQVSLASASSSLKVEVGQSTPISFKVNDIHGVDIAKTLSYTSDLAGRISYGGTEEYEPGDAISIGTAADITLFFTPTEVGNGKLVFTFKGSNDQTETISPSIEVQKADFIWDLKSKPKLSVYPNQSAEISINFKPNLNLTGYTWRYTSTGGTLMLGEAEKNPDQDYDLTGAQTLALRYSDSQSGVQELTFTAADGFDHRETIPVEITVKEPRYQVELVKGESTLILDPGQLAQIAFAVTNTDGVNLPKTLIYSIDADEESGLDGTILYGSKEYEPGDRIPIGTEKTIKLSFTRKPNNPEKPIPYDLTFTFDDGNSKETVPVSIKSKVTISFVDFDATATDEGVAKEIKFNIACHDTDCSDYTVIYQATPGGAGTLYEGSDKLTLGGTGTPISFDDGLFSKTLSFETHEKWKNTGPVRIIVKVVHNGAQTYQNEVSWTVNRVP